MTGSARSTAAHLKPMTTDAEQVEPTLSPTECLILDVLAARARLGEHLWAIETRNAKALRSLAEKGLVRVHSGNVEKHNNVSLTADGYDVAVKESYVPPIFRPECSSWYMGPKTGGHRWDCQRKNGHKGKHRCTYAQMEVRWSTKEALALLAQFEMQSRRYAHSLVIDTVRTVQAEKPRTSNRRIIAHAAERLLLSTNAVDWVLAQNGIDLDDDI